MKMSEVVFSLLRDKHLIGLLSPKNADQCLTAYEVLSPLGIVLEIAFRTEEALNGIRAIKKEYPDALILAGTVMTPKQAESAIHAGVAGIISADYIPSVVEVAVRHDILCVPGGLGDVGKQLVHKAELYGCTLEELKERYPYQWIYKIFPAVAESQSYFQITKAWKGPFKGLTVVYTGGVSLDTLEQIAGFDPDGIFCGSALTRAIDNPEMMKEEALKWLSIVWKR
ncbi:bifunctional 4-hydroxy-2-oxoglutarate aldolase/2-dehydro-3-deoxy-phosphogluconate aldolase [bacterium]|nr:bifunctional 4-hydroxy-2-oxoglutarate aldolase/2-dehydro-3-deoxy-phosphogluconate aldolase [bacterium]RQV92036.1 MAG: bifunctional 4-hydroxy-2-oxoglutarate aldolase/2-dehydro-3-deoxy-phosphogluconate aldolase [bacterium]